MRRKQQPRGQFELHVTCCGMELGEAVMLTSGEDRNVEIMRAGYGRIEFRFEGQSDKWNLHCPECGSHTQVNIAKLVVLVAKLRDAHNDGIGPRTFSLDTSRLVVLLSQVAKAG